MGVQKRSRKFGVVSWLAERKYVRVRGLTNNLCVDEDEEDDTGE